MTIIKRISFLILHLICIICILLFFDTPLNVDMSYQRICIFLYLIATVLYFLFIRNNKDKNHLSFNNIFLFGFFIVFFQVIILQHFDYYLPTWSYNKYWSNSEIENTSLITSVLAITLYMLGNSYGRCGYEVKSYKINNTSSIYILLIIAYFAYFLFFATSGSYRSGVYYAGDSLSVSNYFLKLFNASITAAIIVKITSIANTCVKISLLNYLSKFGAPLLLLLGWHILFSLYVGDRGVIISYGLLVVSLYIYKFRRIKIIELVILILSASILMSVIGQVRQSKDYLQQLETTFSDNKSNSRWYSEKVPGDSFIELAHSGRTLNHALVNVPNNYDFRYGAYAIKRIAGVIPGAQGLLSEMIDDGEKKYASTSEFISFLIQGDNTTYGDGTSITADLYLDFGFLGVFLGMFIFGYFMATSERIISNDYISYLSLPWISFLIYYSKSIYLSRASIFLELSGIFLVWFFIYFNHKFFYYFKK
ncbi:O-antigen polysaccharide polymerase Wzy [Shewanella sp. ALD9]|uniref:O-antigen polysaccharide polymerase Wzy n=1 Tax=Shewanella sp. ALD9 TaxID=2058330 RepID=UPI000C3291AF|nr:O-antigen polysaccharide polymerase Wzy [Shewanella sp. ALD9]PKH31895.1 hypothetical protein CXF88_08295 [Shewanella sp. ALD9]